MPAEEQPRRGRRARRPRLAVFTLLAGIVIVIGAGGGLLWASHTGHPATAAGTAHHQSLPAPPKEYLAAPIAAAAPPPEAAEPTDLTIPAIGVRTSLIHLGINSDGTLQVPSTTKVAGWYTGSPRPGDTGSAVIAGHVDSYLGPGVFFKLRLLHTGDEVEVRRADGTTAVFRVTDVQLYSKTAFPTESVYGTVPDAELRLITCGGTFDPQTGHYLSNVVVSAQLVTSSGSTTTSAG
jgi:sortase (surface protein transpeptidase)